MQKTHNERKVEIMLCRLTTKTEELGENRNNTENSTKIIKAAV